ncbi:hypothetical protein [Streptomyces sp. NPDC004284]|uniref:hypothetical protein n=1 Tax=Streptomyces sp. NPDC004284 TaxID=3364695 RepID=UPI003696E647
MSPDPHTPITARLGEPESTMDPTGHAPESIPSHHSRKSKTGIQLPLARGALPSHLHFMGCSRWHGHTTLSVISLTPGELPFFIDRLRLHQKAMRRPRPGRFGGPATEFFRTLTFLTFSRTTVFHAGKTHEEQAFQRAMARIATHLDHGDSALVLMRTSGNGHAWYRLTRDEAVLLPPGSTLTAGLPCSEADALLPVDLARDHAWASHQYRNRPDTTDDPRRPSSPPPGAAPETL